MATTLYLVFREPGPAWGKGKGSREQPLWDEHAAFMDRLFAQRRIVLGGPYADYSRILVVVEAPSAHAATEMFRDDPWTKCGMLVDAAAIEWTIFLDSRYLGG